MQVTSQNGMDMAGNFAFAFHAQLSIFPYR